MPPQKRRQKKPDHSSEATNSMPLAQAKAQGNPRSFSSRLGSAQRTKLRIDEAHCRPSTSSAPPGPLLKRGQLPLDQGPETEKENRLEQKARNLSTMVHIQTSMRLQVIS